MADIRRDYLLDRWVIVVGERGKRPYEFSKEPSQNISQTDCAFCPGNESLTPPETGRYPEKKKWKIRWFPNKYPAVTTDEKTHSSTEKFFVSKHAYGIHEIIVDTPDHSRQLSQLSKVDICELFAVYSMRIRELSKRDNIKYVVLFKNEGREAGASLIHAHSQVVALSLVPPLIMGEVSAAKKFEKRSGKCPFCEIISKESRGPRKIFENRDFISFAPYASRFKYEVWIFPKKHVRSINELNNRQLTALSDILVRLLGRLCSWRMAYNFYLHNSPGGENLHFHIELTPKASLFAGFEYSTDIIINTLPPETAAQHYLGRYEQDSK